jgi:hypothetical protein
MPTFIPKKPVKSFMDLDVYQKLLENAVFVSKYIVVPPLPAEAGYNGQNPLPAKAVAGIDLLSGGKEQGDAGTKAQEEGPFQKGGCNVGTGTARELIFHQMLPCALGLPHLIAEAHSVRFGGQKECLVLLERAMLNCNKMVVYLEETRDIAETGVAWDKFNDLIKKYQYTRQKILNLQRSWRKYMEKV